MSPHLRSVVFYVVSLYLLTVPLALYLLGLISPGGALRIGIALHVLVIIPLGIAEVRSHTATAVRSSGG